MQNVYRSVPGRYPNKLQDDGRTHTSPTASVRNRSEGTDLRQTLKKRVRVESSSLLGTRRQRTQSIREPQKDRRSKAVEVAREREGASAVPRLCQLLQPLRPQLCRDSSTAHRVTEKGVPFWWGEMHTQAVEKLKQALTLAPGLILPDPDKDYVLEADASNAVVGVVLMQDRGKGLQPIAYLSTKLYGAQPNYPIHGKDALAIIIALKNWRCHLEGATTTVYTDHCSLKFAARHDAIMVVIEKFSKTGHFLATHANTTIAETARLFFHQVAYLLGIPRTLISDRDLKFTSKFWKELMRLLGTRLAMSSTYHPQTDGQTERPNLIVEQLLRFACMDKTRKWDQPVTSTGIFLQQRYPLCYGTNTILHLLWMASPHSTTTSCSCSR
ncbi:hypothetical protein CLOP_g21142 [Closterium sp. NIES-67]|nr:hypothetical protein CLOP_g21142 [Closterium sp. NIES-67]